MKCRWGAGVVKLRCDGGWGDDPQGRADEPNKEQRKGRAEHQDGDERANPQNTRSTKEKMRHRWSPLEWREMGRNEEWRQVKQMLWKCRRKWARSSKPPVSLVLKQNSILIQKRAVYCKSMLSALYSCCSVLRSFDSLLVICLCFVHMSVWRLRHAWTSFQNFIFFSFSFQLWNTWNTSTQRQTWTMCQ